MSLINTGYRRKFTKLKARFLKPHVPRVDARTSGRAPDLRLSEPNATPYVAPHFLWVQPIIDTSTSSVVKLSIIRSGSTCIKDWQLAELQSICGLAKGFDMALPYLSLLCTPPDLRSPQFLHILETCLMTSGLSPNAIEIAVPETFFVDTGSEMQYRLEVLKGWGVELAIYNFGARIASFSCLEHANISSIMLAPEISERLTTPLKNPHYPLALVRAVAEAASLLDMSVTATGVRLGEQHDRLKALGCGLQQGSFFAAPTRIEHTDIWVEYLAQRKVQSSNDTIN